MIREILRRLRQDRGRTNAKTTGAITFLLYKPVSIVVRLVAPVSTFFLPGVHVRSNGSLCWLGRACLSSFILRGAGIANQRPGHPPFDLDWTSHRAPVCPQGFVRAVLSTTRPVPGPPRA